MDFRFIRVLLCLGVATLFQSRPRAPTTAWKSTAPGCRAVRRRITTLPSAANPSGTSIATASRARTCAARRLKSIDGSAGTGRAAPRFFRVKSLLQLLKATGCSGKRQTSTSTAWNRAAPNRRSSVARVSADARTCSPARRRASICRAAACARSTAMGMAFRARAYAVGETG